MQRWTAADAADGCDGCDGCSAPPIKSTTVADNALGGGVDDGSAGALSFLSPQSPNSSSLLIT